LPRATSLNPLVLLKRVIAPAHPLRHKVISSFRKAVTIDFSNCDQSNPDIKQAINRAKRLAKKAEKIIASVLSADMTIGLPCLIWADPETREGYKLGEQSKIPAFTEIVALLGQARHPKSFQLSRQLYLVKKAQAEVFELAEKALRKLPPKERFPLAHKMKASQQKINKELNVAADQLLQLMSRAKAGKKMKYKELALEIKRTQLQKEIDADPRVQRKLKEPYFADMRLDELHQVQRELRVLKQGSGKGLYASALGVAFASVLAYLVIPAFKRYQNHQSQ